MKFFRSPYFTPAIHILVWSLLLGIPGFLAGDGSFFGLTKTFFILSSIYHIGIFYLIVYFLQPRLLRKKWWWLFIVCIIALVRISYYLKLFFLRLDPHFQPGPQNSRIILFGIMPFIATAIIFRIVSDRIRFERLEKEARAEHLSFQLKFLRSQVSPHFLFNMMSNMVSLARQKSDILEPSLIKLSELLRYMLYESQEEKISVSKEMEHLENYTDLQKLRFGDDVNVKLKINNDCPECLIEPMLLIPFIENAFKHGIGLQENAYINITITIRKNKLQFSCVNNYNKDNFSKDKNSGIGLVNVKNRLKLLYPKKYELSIDDKSGLFSVYLNLDLA